jgi:hypothetical protein
VGAMTDIDIEALKLEFKNAVVRALTGPGNAVPKDEFRKRGLSDDVMSEIIHKVMAGK